MGPFHGMMILNSQKGKSNQIAQNTYVVIKEMAKKPKKLPGGYYAELGESGMVQNWVTTTEALRQAKGKKSVAPSPGATLFLL